MSIWTEPECFSCQYLSSEFNRFFANICLENLLMSVWTEPECFSCQCLSSGVNWCLPEVFPNVFCRICLKGSLDVSLDQPNIFLA